MKGAGPWYYVGILKPLAGMLRGAGSFEARGDSACDLPNFPLHINSCPIIRVPGTLTQFFPIYSAAPYYQQSPQSGIIPNYLPPLPGGAAPRESAAAAQHGHTVQAFQTNHEGALVDAIQAARGVAAAIIINPGAFTHYAWAIHDALASFAGPIMEVHISNPNAREPWRHTSVVAPVATGSIMGLGMHGYELAVQAIARLLGA